MPAWFRQAEHAPPLPLPRGVAFGDAPREYRNLKDGSLLVWIPPGSFTMGGQGGRSHELPERAVRLTRGLFLGKHEVTWGQYRRFLAAEGRREPPLELKADALRLGREDEYPAFGLSWDQAVDYCRWAGLRLPTEAEWEWAARGGDQERAYPWGDEAPAPERAAYTLEDGRRTHARTLAPVLAFPAGVSRFGAWELAGNLSEWVQDYYAPSYPTEAEVDPRGPARADHGQRVRRGGSWTDSHRLLRARSRDFLTQSTGSPDTGFRVARSPR